MCVCVCGVVWCVRVCVCVCGVVCMCGVCMFACVCVSGIILQDNAHAVLSFVFSPNAKYYFNLSLKSGKLKVDLSVANGVQIPQN